MTMHLKVLLVSLMAGSAVAPALRAQGVAVTEDKPGLKARAKVSAEAATASAQAKVPKGTVVKAELEEEKGTLIYSFDIKTAGKSGIDEVAVDAMTGKVLSVEHESAKAEAKEAAADKQRAEAKAKGDAKAKSKPSATPTATPVPAPIPAARKP
jgi:hypothetical protein